MFKSQTSKPNPSNVSIPLILIIILAVAIDVVASLLLRRADFGSTVRILVALLPIPANVALIVMVLRGIRQLDEFQKRIHFEAVAMAFLSTGLATLMYGYLQKAQIVGPLNVGLVWAFMSFSYAFGYAVSARHYR